MGICDGVPSIAALVTFAISLDPDPKIVPDLPDWIILIEQNRTEHIFIDIKLRPLTGGVRA